MKISARVKKMFQPIINQTNRHKQSKGHQITLMSHNLGLERMIH